MMQDGTNPLSQEHRASLDRRVERLRGMFEHEDVEALLVGIEHDIRYLTGFVGHDSLLLVTLGVNVIISDARYDEMLDPWREIDSVEVVIGPRHALHDAIRTLIDRYGIDRIGIQADGMTVEARGKMAAALAPVRIVDTTGVLATLRASKDEQEVRCIERAVAVQLDALDAALPGLGAGMPESAFCALLEYEMKLRGASGASFDPIIATGANSSRIHHLTSDAPIGDGLLLVDWGATVDGYCSDMTRTFHIGPMPDEIRSMYELVLEAHAAAIEAIEPGRSCAEIDGVARGVIDRGGLGDRFRHGLGHGLGMDVHEPPWFNPTQVDVALEPGMVMTVEPGVYVPGLGGIRIEDDVLVTQEGCRVLGTAPRDLESAMLATLPSVQEVSA